jgi:Immunity protein 49
MTAILAKHPMRDPRSAADRAFETLDYLVKTVHQGAPVDTLCAITDETMAAIAFGSSCDVDHSRILAAFRIEAQAGAALFDLGMYPGEARTYLLGGHTVALRAEAVHDYTLPLDWLNAYSAASAVRDRTIARRLADVPLEVVRRSASVMDFDEYNCALVDGLGAVELHQPRAREVLSRACELAGPKHASVSPEWAQFLGKPLATLALRLAERDVDAFNAALGSAVEQHAVYWSKNIKTAGVSRRDDPFGVLARWPLGLACLAHDRGIPVEVQSSYIPEWIVRGER